MNILVTGGAGYIGSHATKRLLSEGHKVVVIDSLLRGHAAAVEAVRVATNPGPRLVYAKGEVGDVALVTSLLREHGVEAVMHFAALAAVGESVEQPLLYYRNNVASMVGLLEACEACSVERFVFSSSCATYGQPPEAMVPIPEHCPKAPMSPYGRTKLHGEHILEDFAEGQRRAGKPFSFAALRYFNVAGSDRTGVIGEDHDPETHIIPVVLQAALGLRPHVSLFGTDYPTPDGTCVRDYIYVEDLVDAHMKVMQALRPGDMRAYNLGIGKGYSVREIIESVRRVTKRDVKVVESPRRPGDPPRLFANAGKIGAELGWKASITEIDEIVATAWNWFRAHPKGYRS